MVPRESIEALLQDPQQEGRMLAAVLEQLPVAVVVVGAGSLEATAASARARALLGDGLALPPLRNPQGRPVTAGTHPVARAAGHGTPAENELYELVRPDGAVRLVSVTTTRILGADRNPLAVVAIYDDVTERTRRARVEREFIAHAAHELRTPLAAIAGAVEVLQAGAKELPHERDLFLAHVERETDRLSRLTRALLLIARAQANDERPRVAVVALKPLLDDVAASLRPAAGVRLDVRCAPTLAALTNRDLVEQALANLAQNAARHTVKGTIRLRARAQGATAAIEVVDTGPGIPADDQARVFDRFFRSGAGGSAGLGLSIARQAVEAVDGTLELEAGPRGGTTARITLPLARLVTVAA